MGPTLLEIHEIIHNLHSDPVQFYVRYSGAWYAWNAISHPKKLGLFSTTTTFCQKGRRQRG